MGHLKGGGGLLPQTHLIYSSIFLFLLPDVFADGLLIFTNCWHMKTPGPKFVARNILFYGQSILLRYEWRFYPWWTQQPEIPHIWAESQSTCEYGQPVYFARLSRILASPSLPWGKACLNIPLFQDSGYGGDIWLSIQCGTRSYRLHAQITVFPCHKHTISPPIHSPTGLASGTLPFGLLEGAGYPYAWDVQPFFILRR